MTDTTTQISPRSAVGAALDDLRVAHATLSRSPRHGIRGLDLRELAGGATMLLHHVPDVQNAYADAIDAGLRRMPGLTNHGYVLRRVEHTT
jgi:hypothetical protein